LWTTVPIHEVEAKPFTWHEVAAVALDPGARRFAVGGFDGSIEIRELADPLRRGVIPQRLGAAIRALAFHPTENWLAAIDVDGAVQLLSARTGDVIARVPASYRARKRELGIEFDTIGKRLLITRGDDLRVLNTDPDDWATMAERLSGLP
jgi:WD40 repeat protein